MFSAPDGQPLAVRRVASQSPLHQLPGMAGLPRPGRGRPDQGRRRRGRADGPDGRPPDHRRRQAGPAPVRGGLGRRPGPRRGRRRRRRHRRRDPRRRLGGARAGGLALPRRRDRRGRDPPGRRQRQRSLGQPQGDPRRRLPPGQGLRDRRRPRHRGGRPARRHHRPALRGRGATSCATPTTPPAPIDVVPHRHRGQDGRAVRHRLPRRRHRRRPAPRPHRPAHRASACTTAWRSRSSTTCST